MSTMDRTSGSESAVPPAVESAQAKLVYLYLDRAGGAAPADVAAALSLPKLSVLSVLRTLRDRGVVERAAGVYET